MDLSALVKGLSKSALRHIVLKEKKKKHEVAAKKKKEKASKKLVSKAFRTPILYYYEDFVVVRTAKPNKFIYCKLEADVREGEKTVPVRELKESPKSAIHFVLGKKSTVETSSIVTEINMAASHKRGQLEIPRREKLRVRGLLRTFTKKTFGDLDISEDEEEEEEDVVEDVDESEEEEVEEEEEEEKSSATPEGKKRGRPKKTTAAAPSGKKRKTESGAKEVKKRVPKAKLPKFKKGKENPFVEEIKDTECRHGASNDIDDSCCVYCTNKTLIRAVVTGNKTLFKSIFESKNKISSFAQTWSSHVSRGALEEAILAKNKDFIKALMEPKPDSANYKSKSKSKPKFERAYPTPIRISQQGTGKYNRYTFNHRVRALNMSRGNREGNNAFLHDNGGDRQDDYFSWDRDAFASTLSSPDATKEVVDFCLAFRPDLVHTIYDAFVSVVRSGNHKLAAHMANKMVTLNSHGLNSLHEGVLKLTDKTVDDVFKGIKPISATKKANSNHRVTPMHCATINPCDTAIRRIYELNKDINILDDAGRKPIHYAAGCENDKSFTFLLELGCNFRDIDNFKVTPLMIAAEFNRAHNINLMAADGDAIYLNQKNKESVAAIHYAAEHGSTEALEALVEGGANIELTGKNRMTALHCAAMNGQLEAVEYLLSAGAKVTKKDKFKRTALLLSVMNGHTLIANLLLRKGAEYDAPDSSKNSPLHYAAAYGWPEMIPMLVQAGANLNAFNDWKITPLGAAVLKCHTKCVKELLKHDIDVNCKDDEGKSLLSLSLESFNQTNVEQIKFLIKEKGADVNLADNEGMAPIHYLCSYQYPDQFTEDGQEEKRKKLIEQYHKLELELLDALIEGGADINAMSKRGMTPFFIALSEEKSHILDYLSRKKVNFRAKTSTNEGLFHMAASSVFDEKIHEFVLSILKDKATTKELINLINHEGYTPLLKMIKNFASGLDSHKSALTETLRAEAEAKLAEEAKEPENDDDDEDLIGAEEDDDDDAEDDDDEDEDEEDEDDEGFAIPVKRRTTTKKASPMKKVAYPRGGRTKQTARKSTGGKAPRKMLASKAARKAGKEGK